MPLHTLSCNKHPLFQMSLDPMDSHYRVQHEFTLSPRFLIHGVYFVYNIFSEYDEAMNKLYIVCVFECLFLYFICCVIKCKTYCAIKTLFARCAIKLLSNQLYLLWFCNLSWTIVTVKTVSDVLYPFVYMAQKFQ